MNPITVKIDVTKIDKAKLFKGQKGTYLDIVVVPKDPPDQYGNDWMVVQGVSKEERQKGIKGAILGNGRTIKLRTPPRPTQANAAPSADYDPANDDVPF